VPGKTENFELTADQMFQKFDGTVASDARSGKVEGASCQGT
jgi:hypothetical protein